MIAIHDVLPQNASVASRERVGRAWTGDVWRIVPCLAKHRPNLKLRLLDASPSGLLLVSRLDPANTVLAHHEADVSEEYLGQPAPYDDQVQDYLERVEVVSAQDWLHELDVAHATALIL